MAQTPDSTDGSGSIGAFTTLGKIGAAHGVKGWVRLISFTDPAENILSFRQFYLGPRTIPGSTASRSESELTEQIELDDSRLQGKYFVAHIRGCDDRDQAGLYTGRELQVKTASLPVLDAGTYYWYQLEGLKVINLQEENLGSVHHLIETGANDVLVVRSTSDSIDEQERLIPYVREQVVTEVDLNSKTIRVDWDRDF